MWVRDYLPTRRYSAVDNRNNMVRRERRLLSIGKYSLHANLEKEKRETSLLIKSTDILTLAVDHQSDGFNSPYAHLVRFDGEIYGSSLGIKSSTGTNLSRRTAINLDSSCYNSGMNSKSSAN